MDIRLRALAIPALMLLILGASAAPASAVPRASIGRSVPTPGGSSQLSGVAAISPTDAWAVGSYCPSGCAKVTATSRELILHWNGKAWSVNKTGSCRFLSGVSASSPANVWAVGTCPAGPLFLHWAGRKWVRGKTTGMPPAAFPYAVSVRSPTSAWAAGIVFSARLRHYVDFIAHWNGRSWSPQAAPTLGGKNGSSLTDMSADSTKDAWAGGGYCVSGCTGGNEVDRAFVLRWNGTRWKTVSLPKFTFIQSMQALSPSDVWVAGVNVVRGGGANVLLHWNGTKWLHVPPPNFPMSITFASPSDGWALDLGEKPARWNGSRWALTGPSLPNIGGGLNGASADSASDIWVVGQACVPTSCSGPLTRNLIFHWNGTTWTRE